eukprot:1148669-Rhodomonas_salina.1
MKQCEKIVRLEAFEAAIRSDKTGTHARTHTHTHTHTHRGRHTPRQTHTETCAHTCTDRQTDRCRAGEGGREDCASGGV